MTKTLFKLMTVAVLSTALFSCEKGENTDPTNDSQSNEGRVYILNEGVWGGNDAELSRYSDIDNSIANDYFSSKNGRGLGDVANDIEIYGGKMYVVVNCSNTVEVVDYKTGNSIQQIPLSGKQPREVAFYEGYAYVSCYDKTVVKIDTATLSIAAQCQTEGGKCEDLYAHNGYLYVAHAWDQDASGAIFYDSTLSVIALDNFSVVDKITIGLNAKTIKPIGNSNIMVSCMGNYSDIASCLSIINLDSRQVEKLEIEVSNFAVYSNEYALVYSYNWTTSQQVFTKINLTNFAQTQWSYNASQQLVSPYGIGIDPTNEDVYITDAQNYQSNGDVYRFDKNGNHIANKECGIGPSKIIFL
jgi:YVTN family beta-propeller protein